MYLLLAVAAGFASVWLWGIIHRSYEGWYAVAWRVACYFPGISLLLLSVLNVLIHHTGSSGAIPLGAFFSLVALWFLISIPLCFSGQSNASEHWHLILLHPCKGWSDILHDQSWVMIVWRGLQEYQESCIAILKPHSYWYVLWCRYCRY